MTAKEAVLLTLTGLCEERGLTINALATLAGVTPSTVYSLFQGSRKDITLSTLQAISSGLGFKLCEFFALPIFLALEQTIE